MVPPETVATAGASVSHCTVTGSVVPSLGVDDGMIDCVACRASKVIVPVVLRSIDDGTADGG